MRADILRELGLSPVWKRRFAAPAPGAESPKPPAAAGNPKENAAAARNSAPPPPPENCPPDNVLTRKTAPPPENRPPDDFPPDNIPPDHGETGAISTAPPPASPEESGISRMRWQPLRETVATCRRCSLCEKRKQAVFGVGDENADIFFVGEGPGQEEDLRGEPFVGAAGKLLNAMLKSIGISRADGVYIANIVKCRPPQNRKPKPEEASACMPYLHRQLALANPRLIVALGGVAAAHLLQNNEPVGALRQRMHTYMGTPLVVTYHPAYLLRSPSEKRKSWDDLLHIRRLAAKTE